MKEYVELLKPIYTASESKTLVRELICYITGMTTAQIMAQTELRLTEDQQKRIHNAIDRLLVHEPIQHIIGSTYFHGHKFICDKRALIPRPETEELVDWIIADSKGKEVKSILDIGTGTGCIAISLAKDMEAAEVSAMDISLDALSLAKENAKLIGANINFINDNILKLQNDNKNYSLIVSNPPYVRESEKADMDKNVLDYDPSIALFVSDKDPLIFYRAIAEYGLSALNKFGRIFFEVNQYLSRETCAMLVSMGYKEIELRKDINGNPRMIRACRA